MAFNTHDPAGIHNIIAFTRASDSTNYKHKHYLDCFIMGLVDAFKFSFV